MVTGGGWSDSGRGEAGLGVGEGGGGAGEGSRTRNQSMVAGGGRSTEGGDGGASARAELVTGRRMKKRKEDMTGGSHNQDKYLGVILAERPPIPSGLCAVLLGVTISRDSRRKAWRGDLHCAANMCQSLPLT